MRLTLEQISKIALCRKEYMLAFEQWSVTPNNFSAIKEIFTRLARVKLECLDILIDAVITNKINLIDVNQKNHMLFKSSYEKNSRAALIKLNKMIEAEFYNDSCLELRRKCIARHAPITDLQIDLSLQKVPMLNYIISFSDGSTMRLKDLSESHTLHQQAEQFSEIIYNLSRRAHRVTTARAYL